MFRVALYRKQIPKKFILASGGEEGKNEFMVHVQFEAGFQVPLYIPHQAAKGTQSSGWPEKQHSLGWLLSRVQDGVVFLHW